MFFKNTKFGQIVTTFGLDKPLVVFDIEATGPTISMDKIIEIAYLKFGENGMVKKDNIFLNPDMVISQEAATVHGINNDELADKPRFKDRAQEIFDVFHNCYYGGFNIVNYDLPILRREFIRVGMNFEYNNNQIIDIKEVFRFLEPKNLSAAYHHYCDKEIKGKPGAMMDTEIAVEVLSAQAEKYNDLLSLGFIKTMHQLREDGYKDSSQKFYWHQGKTYFSFSKYKDKSLAMVAKEDPKFLEWIISGNFSNETKSIVKMALEKYNSK